MNTAWHPAKESVSLSTSAGTYLDQATLVVGLKRHVFSLGSSHQRWCRKSGLDLETTKINGLLALLQANPTTVGNRGTIDSIQDDECLGS